MTIYKQYNQEELDNQYNNRLQVPDFATYFERWDKLSAATREKHEYIKICILEIIQENVLIYFLPISQTQKCWSLFMAVTGNCLTRLNFILLPKFFTTSHYNGTHQLPACSRCNHG
jgi:hypothetical protein